MHKPSGFRQPESKQFSALIRLAVVPLAMMATFGEATRSVMAQSPAQPEAKIVTPALPPLSARRIAELIEKLGDDEFQTREDVQRELAKYSDAATVRALFVAKNHPRETEGYDAERVLRAGDLADALVKRETDGIFPECKVHPWIGELPKGVRLPQGVMPDGWRGQGWQVVTHYLAKTGDVQEPDMTTSYVRFRLASEEFTKRYKQQAVLASLDARNRRKELIMWAQEHKNITNEWQFQENTWRFRQNAAEAVGGFLLRMPPFGFPRR